ncbi:MAG TPA: DUF2207 domain-containing protein [Propionicimonas sp.]|nr:DUF2207 domain-containing protein [Propionicimonas sp.]HQA77181.1 DUF2207 domain-containing protein [Propionicimonas sp.]HQD96601.1 DUF2207 domain-containing protein [Propionicimonas sp.]
MTRTGLRRWIAGVIATSGIFWWAAPAANAAETVQSFAVNATVNADGSLQVASTLTFDGAPPATLTQALAIRVRTADSYEYRFQIANVAVTSNGQALPAQVDAGADATTVSVDTAGVTGPIEIGYTVVGAAMPTANDTTTIAWALLQGLNVPVAAVDATIAVPAQFTEVDCAAGHPSSPGTCVYYGGGTHDSPSPFLHDENRAAGDVVVATVRFPRSAVAANAQVRQLWTAERAFSVAPWPLGLATGLLALGGLGLWAAHRKYGRDALARSAATPTPVAQFEAVGPGQNEFRVIDDVRPGEVGTLVDERVDPVDVTATLLDLAVRGHLVITQLPSETAYGVTDWTFARKHSDDRLLDYEHTLLDAVAPVQGEPVQVSNLAGSVGAVIGKVQSELYEEVVSRGWFVDRPDATRNRWSLIGWIGLGAAVLAAVLLAAFTRFGLVGLVLVALALGLLFAAQQMPWRTAAGASILGGLDALRAAIQVQPTDSVVVGKAYAGLSAVLPYAVVLGGKERWLDALAAADVDDTADATELDWYHGPEGWNLADLPASLANFITTVQGTLFAR